ncbi:6003_t:CDS:1, partial [Dentiscutata erythropus]
VRVLVKEINRIYVVQKVKRELEEYKEQNLSFERKYPEQLGSEAVI